MCLNKLRPVLWIQIRIKLKGRIRIRIHINVISWIRVNLQMTSQNVWKMSLFEHFVKVLSLYLKPRIRIQIRDPHRSERQDPDSHQSVKQDPDPHRCGSATLTQTMQYEWLTLDSLSASQWKGFGRF
jgi:hypothetical protein